jgi:hypothetical protein
MFWIMLRRPDEIGALSSALSPAAKNSLTALCLWLHGQSAHILAIGHSTHLASTSFQCHSFPTTSAKLERPLGDVIVA